MYIELWTGVRDLAQDNKSSIAKDMAKLFVNYTLRDLALEYDWEFLRGTKGITATAGSGTYGITTLLQPDGVSSFTYATGAATADYGQTIKAHGLYFDANDVISRKTEQLTITAAEATGTERFHSYDFFTRSAVGTGIITVKDTLGNTIVTLGANDTIASNDITKITTVVNKSASDITELYDYNTYQKGNPNGQNLGDFKAYDVDYKNEFIRLFNVDANEEFEIIYQRMPKYLIDNADRSEFPKMLYSQIINAAYIGWQLRYQDEQDGSAGKQAYKELLKQIVDSWLMGRDQTHQQVIPKWFRRSL